MNSNIRDPGATHATPPAAAADTSTAEAALADRFTGRGPWKKSLPGLLEVLESLGRAERAGTADVPAWRVAG